MLWSWSSSLTVIVRSDASNPLIIDYQDTEADNTIKSVKGISPLGGQVDG